jgi:hypothetical protein
MLFFYRNGTAASKLAMKEPGLSLLIELAATHEKLASGIGADEAAFLVEEL